MEPCGTAQVILRELDLAPFIQHIDIDWSNRTQTSQGLFHGFHSDLILTREFCDSVYQMPLINQ